MKCGCIDWSDTNSHRLQNDIDQVLDALKVIKDQVESMQADFLEIEIGKIEEIRDELPCSCGDDD